MLFLCLYLPLLSFLISYICSRWLSNSTLVFLNICLLFLSFIFNSVSLFNTVFLKSDLIVNTVIWITFAELSINWSFALEHYTNIMSFLVLFISLLVHIYSVEYMAYDPYLLNFLGYLSLFTWFMLMFIMSSNFCLIFFSWEGVGLMSYLLINYWDSRIRANNAALKAIIINSVSDVFIYFAILLLFVHFKTLEYSLIFSLLPVFSSDIYIYSIGFCLFIGAVGNSAQFGLHTWLPDAMEGPTPVSALLHAATMVTAGVFLIIRCFSLFDYANDVLLLMVWLGSCVTFFSGSLGCFTFDLKSIIAFSTCSQLGLMFLFCGCSHYDISFFHLFNHAYFKALLFLCAGVLIHTIADEQDIRRFGGLSNLAPLLYISIFIGSLAICGFPFLTGFYSNDVLSELSVLFYLNINPLVFLSLCSISIFFTCVYSFRLLLYCFFSQGNFFYFANIQHDTSWFSLFVLFILTWCSIFVGFLSLGLFSNLTLETGGFIYSNLFSDITNVDYGLQVILHYLPLILGASGSLFGLVFYYISFMSCQVWFSFLSYFNMSSSVVFSNINTSSLIKYILLLGHITNQSWFFDYLYNNFLAQSVLIFSNLNILIIIDSGFIDFISFNWFLNSFSLFYSSLINFFFFKRVYAILFHLYYIKLFWFWSSNYYRLVLYLLSTSRISRS